VLREGLEKGTGYSCDYRIMLPDGSIRYIHAEADRPVKDESGRVVRWFGVVQDVTEHKQIEEALRVSEERYRLLAETTQDMIHIIDRDLRVTYVNRAGADALGSTPEEVIGEQLETFFPPTTYKHMKNSLLRVFRSGKPITGQIMHQFYNGKISMHVILSPLFNNDGTVDGVMGSTRDITKLIETEEALLKSDSEFRALLQNIGSGVALIDETGRFAVVNPAFMRMFGLDRESDILNVNSQDWGRWKMYGEHLNCWTSMTTLCVRRR